MILRATALAAGVVAAAAVTRQRREIAARARGESVPGVPASEPSWTRALAQWQPGACRTAGGQALACAWAAPLSVPAALVGVVSRGSFSFDRSRRVLVVDEMSAPGRWLLGWGRAAAMTAGHVVLVGVTDPSEQLLDHEALHARQAERLGPLMPVLHTGMTAWMGYRRNPLERAARAAASQQGERRA